MIKESKQITPHKDYIGPIMIGVFFCFLFFVFGAGTYPDTESYVTMSIDREPLYSTFLWGLRIIMGSYSFVAASFLQNLLAFWVTTYLYVTIKKMFQLNWLFSIGVIVCLFMPHILTPLLTPSKMILTNSILSEGITNSLYTLFFTLLILATFDQTRKSGKYAGLSLFVAFLLALTRSQLMIAMLIWGFVLIVKSIIMHKKKNIVVIGSMIVLAFILKSLGVNTYNYIVNDHFTSNTGGNLTILTNVLYSTDLEEQVEFTDPDIDALYEEIVVLLQERKLNYAYSESGIVNHIIHHEDCHDIIKYNVIDLPIYEYVKAHGATDSVSIKKQVNEVAATLYKELLPDNLTTWITIYIQVALGGLIRTVAVIHPILNWYSLLIYLAAISMTFLLLKKTWKRDTISKSAVIMLIVLLMIAANVFATALMIMCLSRYMIYNTAFFYIGGLLMIHELWQDKKGI